MMGEEWTTEMNTQLGSDMKVTATGEHTLTFNATESTLLQTLKNSYTFSGGKINTGWSYLKAMLQTEFEEEYGEMEEFSIQSFDDEKHTMTIEVSLPPQPLLEIPLPLEDYQINQNGTKLKMFYTDSTDSTYSTYSVIYIKQ